MNSAGTSRRNFLKTAAVTAASLPLAGMFSPGRAAEPGRKLGFALVGLGNLSTNQIAPALQKTQYCRLAGIVTGTPAKAAKWQAQYNIPEKNIYNYDTIERLADNPNIDVVYIVTPNSLHARDAIKAAKAGKHVLCEKPMEVSTEKCQAMIDACKEAGRQLAIGYRLHFDPNNLECIRLGREKVFGDIRLIQASFSFSIGDPAQWRLHRPLSGGGPLMDIGIYALQASRYLTGEEPIEVSATTTTTDHVKFQDVEESIMWESKFPSGVIAQGCASYKVFGMEGFRVFADKGWYGLDPAWSYGYNHGTRSDGKTINEPNVDQFAAEMDDFAQCILNNRPTSVPGEEGLRDVKILMAIYEAARTGTAVKLR